MDVTPPVLHVTRAPQSEKTHSSSRRIVIMAAAITLCCGVITFFVSVPVYRRWASLISHFHQSAAPDPQTLDSQIAARSFQALQSISPVTGENRLWIHFVEDWFPVPLDDREERQYSLARLVDSKPPLSPAWFLPDDKLSEVYGDFLGALQEDERVRREFSSATDKVADDFFKRLNHSLAVRRRVRRQTAVQVARTQDVTSLMESLAALDSSRKLLRGHLSRTENLGGVGRAYYDFVDSDDDVIQYQGRPMSVKPFTLSPDLEKWIRQPVKSLESIGSGTAELHASVEQESSTSPPAVSATEGLVRTAPIIVKATLYARKFRVFSISRKPWFHEELLESYRRDPTVGNNIRRFYGLDGLLSLIPTALVMVQEPTYVVTLSEDDFRRTQQILKSGARLFLSIGSSRLIVDGTRVTADTKSFSWRIAPPNPKAVQLVAVISRMF